MLSVMSNPLVLLVCFALAQGTCVLPEKSDYEFSVAVIDNKVMLGRQPRFLITIRNMSDKCIRFPDIERRADWSDHLLEIVVSKDKFEIPFGISISDPGFLRESDFVIIPPHGRREFRILSYMRKFDVRLPGLYTAKASLKNFSGGISEAEPVSFTVYPSEKKEKNNK